jgi:hypothetical protein
MKMKEKSINERIVIICNKYNLNANSMSKRIKISQPTMKSILDGDTKPNFSTIEKILKEFPINADWLILDIGNMERNSIENTIQGQDQNNSNFQTMLNKISELSAENAVLKYLLESEQSEKKLNIAAEKREKYGGK